MSRRLVYKPTADRDLLEITDYLSDRSPSAARRFQAAYFDVAEDLVRFPLRGAVDINDPTEQLRRVILPKFKNYLVYYRVSEDAVTIHRILHSSRDLPAQLK